jgi:hypothetical protein
MTLGPTSGEAEAVARLVAFVRGIKTTGSLREYGRASAPFDHIGAKPTDATLQRGTNYETTVRGRVEPLATQYPDAATTSGLMSLISSTGAAKLLGVKGGPKPRTFEALAAALAAGNIETVADLREFLSDRWHANSLRRISGVGAKTVAFLKLVVGLDALAVDRHILEAFEAAGVPPCDSSETELLAVLAAHELGIPLTELDSLLWVYQSSRGTSAG